MSFKRNVFYLVFFSILVSLQHWDPGNGSIINFDDYYEYQIPKKFKQDPKKFTYDKLSFILNQKAEWLKTYLNINEEDTFCKQIKVDSVVFNQLSYLQCESTDEYRNVKKSENIQNFSCKNAGARIIESSPSIYGIANIQESSEETYLYFKYKTGEPYYFSIQLSEVAYVEEYVITFMEKMSTTIKAFKVYGSLNLVSSSWALLGVHEMQLPQSTQKFRAIKPQYVRYIKFEILSVHNANFYYCTLTRVKVFGKNAIEMQSFKEQNSSGTLDDTQNTDSVQGLDSKYEIVKKNMEQNSCQNNNIKNENGFVDYKNSCKNQNEPKYECQQINIQTI